MRPHRMRHPFTPLGAKVEMHSQPRVHHICDKSSRSPHDLHHPLVQSYFLPNSKTKSMLSHQVRGQLQV